MEGLIILAILMAIMLILRLKYKKFELMLLVMVFSLFIFFNALSDADIPFSPYFQLFFVAFQSIIMIYTSVEYYEEKGKAEKD